MLTREHVSVICSDCEEGWSKRKDSLVMWNGRCRKCAQRFEKNKPAYKELHREVSRKQVLKQGGIPNRVMFGIHKPTQGKYNNHWKGGITPLNQKIRHSSQYVEWRKKVFNRDNFICQICGSRGGKLEAHHIKPFSLFPELRFDINNGATMCKTCHHKKGIHLLLRSVN